MKTDSLRVVIAGYGWFGKLHHQVWRRIPEVTVVAVIDPNTPCFQQERSAQDDFHETVDAGRDGVDVLPRFDSLAEALQNIEFDFLDIVAPEELHYELALAAVRSGKFVFIEKPFSTSAEHSRELLDAARQGQIFVGHILRFDRRFRAVKLHMDKGDRLITASLARDFQRSALNVYGRTHPVFAASTHDIDLAVWLFGGAPASVFAMAHSDLGRKYPDTLAVLLRWDDGRIVTIRNSWHLAKNCPFGFTFSSVFIGERATYSVQNQPDIEIWDGDTGVHCPELFFWPQDVAGRSGALHDELLHAARCAISGTVSNIVPVEDAHSVVCTSAAILESCRSGREEKVKMLT